MFQFWEHEKNVLGESKCFAVREISEIKAEHHNMIVGQTKIIYEDNDIIHEIVRVECTL
jgi:hypothetical protein